MVVESNHDYTITFFKEDQQMNVTVSRKTQNISKVFIMGNKKHHQKENFNLHYTEIKWNLEKRDPSKPAVSDIVYIFEKPQTVNNSQPPTSRQYDKKAAAAAEAEKW